MKSFWVAFCVAAWSVLAAWAVEVEGVVTLSNGNPPAGIQVIFTAESPSAHSDTAQANDRGYFEISLAQGWYNVSYHHPYFAVYDLGSLNIRLPLVLSPVVLMPPLQGALNGEIGPGDFQVTDTLRVPIGITATLRPGTRFYFDRNLPFRIEGQLIALGTPEDSIVFSRRYTSGFEATWNGLIVLNTGETSQFDYAVIEHATKTGYQRGGGMRCVGSSPHISHSTIRYNHADQGGGLYLEQSTAEVESCAFVGNISTGGAGICLTHAAVQIHDCDFRNNAANVSGGGIFAQEFDSSTVTGCGFEANSAFDGAGIAMSYSPLQVSECLFARNTSPRTAGVLCSNAGTARIVRCTMTRNSGPLSAAFSSLSIIGGTPTVSSVIIAETGVYFGMMFTASPQAEVRYCDVFVSGGDPFGFPNADSTQGPRNLGVWDTLNTHGDTCDAYVNIFVDPEFVNPDSDNYHLNFWSPCIDTGDPDLAPDPDGTTADIGAFYYQQVTAAKDPFILPPSSFILSSYPNPFNGTTRIAFDLPRAGETELTVYDITGRQVATLLSGPLSAGHHDASWNATDVPSGVYIYRLRTPETALSGKMVLIK